MLRTPCRRHIHSGSKSGACAMYALKRSARRPRLPKPRLPAILRAYVRRAVRKAHRHAPEAHRARRSDGRCGQEGLREIRRILLEADVSFDLTREFLERVQAKAVGQSRPSRTCGPGTSSSRSSTTSWSALLGEKQAPIALRHRCRPPSSCWSGCRARARPPPRASSRGGSSWSRRRRSWSRPTSIVPPPSSSWQTLGRQVRGRRLQATPARQDVVKIVRRRHRRGAARRGRAPSSSTPPAGCRSTTR